ncbi:hypothetical protein WA026_016404 [Henosepilachna vigintioctopunctata]|uniref:Cilia- and flagella-associated protein 157 n=1 Tax=Henosepilachna vigintioctopunctata TaxID=420089 RepID=A0AAW1ULZ6_9CUCU
MATTPVNRSPQYLFADKAQFRCRESLRRYTVDQTLKAGTLDVEAIFCQMNADLLKQTEHLKKLTRNLDETNAKISELRKTIENIETQNEILEKNYNYDKEKMTLLDDDNRKYTNTFVENTDKIQAFYAENKLLHESIAKCREENDELKKYSEVMNDALKVKTNQYDRINATMIDKYYLNILQEQLQIAQNLMHIHLMKKENVDELKEDIRALTNYNNLKLTEVEKEKENIQEQLIELKIKSALLKDQLIGTESLSDHSKLFASESRKSIAHFQESTKWQKAMTTRLTKRLKIEENVGEKLTLWMKESKEENLKLKQKLRTISVQGNIGPANVKNEIISIDEDDFLIDLTQIIKGNQETISAS